MGKEWEMRIRREEEALRPARTVYVFGSEIVQLTKLCLEREKYLRRRELEVGGRGGLGKKEKIASSGIKFR